MRGRALIVLWCVMAAALAGQQPSRDATRIVSSGSAVLSGRLNTGDSPARPVRRAVITLSNGNAGADRGTVTEDDGTFHFDRLPAGMYTVVAAKPAWVSSYYGSSRPGRGPGLPIAIANGQHLSIDVTMLPGAVISGRVLDHTGHPRASSLRLLQWKNVDGQRLLSAVPISLSTSGGTFRIYGLAPGSYLLVARGSAPADIDGHFQVSASIIDRALSELAENRPPSAPGSGLGAVSMGTPIALAPTFYPSAIDPEQATMITLAAGEERSDIEIRLRAGKSTNLAGLVVDPQGGAPKGLQVALISPATALGLASDLASSPTMSTQNGEFSRGGLPAGHYVLFARAQDTPSPGPAASPAAALLLWGRADFDLAGEDVQNLVVRLERGRTVSGHVVFDHAGQPVPTDVSSMQLRLVPKLAGGFNLSVAPVKCSADGRFSFAGVAPGRYLMTASFPGSSWALDSAMAGSVDVLDTLLTTTADADVENVVVTMTDHAPTLAGSLVDQDGTPRPEYTIVVIPTDRNQWTTYSRRITQLRPAHDGHFVVKGLPPGEYYVGAIAGVEPADLADTVFLEALAAASTRVTLASGEARTIDLQVKHQGGT